jgi:uncharacterized protein (DUF2141 family)
MNRRTVLALSPMLIAASSPVGALDLSITGLRNEKGLVHVCLTANRAHFPDCAGDPRAIRQSIPATQHELRLTGIAPGHYAVTLMHDENSNRRLDKMVGIPREGFGFSRNPVVRFGPPRFENTVIDLDPGVTRATVRLQYLL